MSRTYALMELHEDDAGHEYAQQHASPGGFDELGDGAAGGVGDDGKEAAVDAQTDFAAAFQVQSEETHGGVGLLVVVPQEAVLKLVEGALHSSVPYYIPPSSSPVGSFGEISQELQQRVHENSAQNHRPHVVDDQARTGHC